MNKPRRYRVKYIFTAYVTRKDGTRDYAKDHGLKAFRIPVKDKR